MALQAGVGTAVGILDGMYGRLTGTLCPVR